MSMNDRLSLKCLRCKEFTETVKPIKLFHVKGDIFDIEGRCYRCKGGKSKRLNTYQYNVLPIEIKMMKEHSVLTSDNIDFTDYIPWILAGKNDLPTYKKPYQVKVNGVDTTLLRGGIAWPIGLIEDRIRKAQALLYGTGMTLNKDGEKLVCEIILPEGLKIDVAGGAEFRIEKAKSILFGSGIDIIPVLF